MFDPSAPVMPGMDGFGFGNMYAPAMQANDAMAMRRRAMAQRLMQGQPQQQPMQPQLQPMVDQGGAPGRVSAGFDGAALGSTIGTALNAWLNQPSAPTTGMGVQMGGLY